MKAVHVFKFTLTVLVLIFIVACSPQGEASNDSTAPRLSNSQPSGTLVVGTSKVTVSLNTDENATCNYSIGTTQVEYNDMPNSFTITGGLTHSMIMTGLANGQAYDLYVRCRDIAGNINSVDFLINFNVSSGSTSGSINKILFIGNSYTGHSGGVHNHFQKMMEESGRVVEVAGEIYGGEAFSYKNETYPGFVNRSEVTARIKTNDWDAVILQSYYEPEQAFYDAGGILIDRVKSNGSDPVLFMIWGHELHPAQDDMFRQRTEKLGQDKNTLVAAIGIGIRAAHNSGIEVYSDGAHMSLSGAYLTAAIFYSFFTGESPLGIEYDGYIGSGYFGRLTAGEIAILQTIAWQTVADYGVLMVKEVANSNQ